MFEHEDLLRMSLPERRALATRLANIDGVHPLRQISPLHRRLGRAFLVSACTVTVLWITTLLATLPDRYTTTDWRLAWIGFDTALLAVLAALTCFLWRLRQIAIMFMIVAATLLVCDAWFDVTLTWNGADHWASLATALGGEMPLATLLLVRARRLLTLTAAVAASDTGSAHPPRALHRIALFEDESVNPAEPHRERPNPAGFIPRRPRGSGR
jgi:hypothetical protein